MELFEFEADFVRGTATASVLSYVTHIRLKIEAMSWCQRYVIICKQQPYFVFLIANYVKHYNYAYL